MAPSGEPLFSVIITTYNRRELLPRAMASVLEQRCGDLELLVIDNGSTDGTREAVEAIGDPRVRYVRNPRPTGSCDGPRNHGLALARGRYTAFLDDDDAWYPEKLEKVKAAFEADPRADAA
jgi:glycosyltransferase involved in cell wall biosynthesis